MNTEGMNTEGLNTEGLKVIKAKLKNYTDN